MCFRWGGLVVYGSKEPGTGRFVTSVDFLKPSTITIREGEASSRVLRHEIGHADQRIRDPLQYIKDISCSNIYNADHDDRPAEIYANTYERNTKRRDTQ